jgi:hypothetical protein
MRVDGIAIVALAVSGLACGRTTPVVVPAPPEAPAEPTEPPLGASRFNPAPFGTAIQIDGMSLYVTDVVFPADTIVREGNLFNPTPEPASDYILVGVKATCNLPAESSCRLSGLEFSLVDTAGIAHNPRLLIAGVPGKFEGGEFFGGATRSGYLIYVVNGDPGEYILKYQALFGGEAYLALQ